MSALWGWIRCALVLLALAGGLPFAQAGSALQITDDLGPESHGVAALDGQWTDPQPDRTAPVTTARERRSTR